MVALAVAPRVAHDSGMLERGKDGDRRSPWRSGSLRTTADAVATPRRRPRTLIGAASIIAVAALAVACAACGGRSADSSAVAKLLDHQLALTKAGDWQGLYDTYSPHYQSRCPYEALLKRAAGSDTASLRSLSYDQLHVEIDGDKAYVTYVTTRNGKVVAAVTDASPDIYVKIDGTWFDENDELAACSRGNERPSPTEQPAPGT